MSAKKEFLMTSEDFNYIRDTVYDTCGIVLGEHKKEMVYSRIARRIRALHLTNCASYIGYLIEHSEEEFSNFINAITTNLTSFFRENHHFAFLTDTIIAELKEIHQKDRRIRIWSAGCSTGEEPYSIAMTIAEHFKRPAWDLKILASDLDSNVLASAQKGVYRSETVTGLNPDCTERWFSHDGNNEKCKVNANLQTYIQFKRLNLLAKWPMKGPFDVIFCRNVVIYFDQATKDTLFKRYAQMLRKGGYLILGHSESMNLKQQTQFKSLGKTIYQNIG
ncbi:MAG: chemotaxis protein methyltransferase CheR [Alteromonadaceae bacterium]|jgi:chemotaxis protein methyltransferase CheR